MRTHSVYGIALGVRFRGIPPPAPKVHFACWFLYWWVAIREPFAFGYGPGGGFH